MGNMAEGGLPAGPTVALERPTEGLEEAGGVGAFCGSRLKTSPLLEVAVGSGALGEGLEAALAWP